MPDNALFVGPLDRVLSLKTLPMLEALSSRELVAIAQRMRERFIPRGSMLLREGGSVSASYLILDGSLELATEEGPHLVERGSPVGLLELLAREPFPCDVRAAVDTLVLELDADDHEDLWEEHFPILLEHIKYLARETLEQLRARDAEFTEATPDSGAAAFGSPLNLVERILTLHRVPLLSSESIDAVAELSGHLTELRVERGERLWHDNDESEHFWVILSGRARARLRGSSAGFDSGAGACLGLEETLADVPRWNDAWAEEALLTLRIARGPFVDVLEDHFPMARHVVMTMAKRFLTLRARR